MKLFQNSCSFDYPWEQVTAANWKKYPNEVSTHVVAVDVLRRELQDSGTKLVSERLITCQQNVPNWIMMLVGGSNISYVREVSTVDLNTRELTMRSCNLTYSNLLKVYETVRYTPHPENPLEKTLFKQEAQITSYSTFQRICNKMEEWSVHRFKDNARKGKMGFDSVLKCFAEQTDKYVDGFLVNSNSLVNKVNETVEDLVRETEKTTSMLYHNSELFKEAFERTNSSNNA